VYAVIKGIAIENVSESFRYELYSINNSKHPNSLNTNTASTNIKYKQVMNAWRIFRNNNE